MKRTANARLLLLTIFWCAAWSTVSAQQPAVEPAAQGVNSVVTNGAGGVLQEPYAYSGQIFNSNGQMGQGSVFDADWVQTGTASTSTYAALFRGRFRNFSGTPSVPDVFGMYFTGWTKAGGSTVTRSSVIEIDDSTRIGTTAWTIHSTSLAPSLFSGPFQFNGTTSGTVTVQPAPVAGTWTFTWPTNAGVSGASLQTDGNRITSWVSPTQGSSVFTQPRDPAVSNPSGVVTNSVWLDTVRGPQGLRVKLRNSANTTWQTSYWDVPLDGRLVPNMAVNLTVADLDGLRDGATLTAWKDSSGNGNNASLVDVAKPLNYYAALGLFEDGLPFIDASALNGQFSVPIPATGTKTIFMVVYHFPGSPLLSSPPLYFSADALIFGDYQDSTYAGWKTAALGQSDNYGYGLEWSVLCWRQNGTTVDLYSNGVLGATWTLSAASTTATMLIGGGGTFYRQVLVFPSTLTPAQVALYSDSLQRFWTINYKVTYLADTGSGNQRIFLQKKGLVGLRPLVIFNHASGETERMWRTLPAFRALVTACVEAGYIVGFSRQHGDSWGNNDSLADNQSVYDYAVASLSADPNKVAMVGDSMGGIPAMLSFPLTTIPLKGAALYYPVQDVAFQRTFKPAMGTAIDAAYPPDFPTSGTGHNPLTRAASDWSGKRFIWFGSTSDTVVPYTQNTAAMRTLIAGVATENTFVELNADHNDATGVASTQQALLDFLARCFQ